MRFVAMKSREQQSLMMLHSTRSLLVRQRTMLVNALRAHLTEFGIVAPVGRNGLQTLLAVVCDPKDERLQELRPENCRSRTRPMTFWLHPDQEFMVSAAIEEAKRRAGTLHAAVALDRMAMEFLSCPAPWAQGQSVAASDETGDEDKMGADDGVLDQVLLLAAKSCLARVSRRNPAVTRKFLASALGRLVREDTGAPEAGR
jgi:hypothetical protein